jgi:uncharacterized protein
VNLCDVNVWLALALSKHVHHRAVRRWFDGIDQPGALVFCRATQQALLRLLTNPAVLAPYGNPPLSNAAAWRIYEAFAADDRVTSRTDEPAHVEVHWKRFALRDSASPKLWMDAYLAAFAVAAGLRLVTTDAAFRQFAGLDAVVLA